MKRERDREGDIRGREGDIEEVRVNGRREKEGGGERYRTGEREKEIGKEL